MTMQKVACPMTIVHREKVTWLKAKNELSDIPVMIPGRARGRTRAKEIASRPNAGATAICGKVEAELAEMSDEESADFLASYGLHESGLVRLIRKSYELLGLMSFFTVGEDECRAWTVERGIRAQQAAGAIHSDLEKHFIRAETIHWDKLLAAGSPVDRSGPRVAGPPSAVACGPSLSLLAANR